MIVNRYEIDMLVSSLCQRGYKEIDMLFKGLGVRGYRSRHRVELGSQRVR